MYVSTNIYMYIQVYLCVCVLEFMQYTCANDPVDTKIHAVKFCRFNGSKTAFS